MIVIAVFWRKVNEKEYVSFGNVQFLSATMGLFVLELFVLLDACCFVSRSDEEYL